MKALVTGGAGYVGSHTVDALIRRGHEVVVVDDLSLGHRQAVHRDARLVVADLLEPAPIRQLMAEQRFDGIFHFASRSTVGESVERPWLYLRDNVVGASHLLEAAVDHGVQRFILSSTANLFDRPERIPIAEDERIIPGSPYGESKATIERLLHWMHVLHGLRYCCLRYFNAAGAHEDGHIGEDHRPETHLIPIVLQVALGQREHIRVNGDDYPTPDGTCVRDYINVMDLASAHVLAFEALGAHDRLVYNLGVGRGHSIRQVVEVARAVTGHPIPMVMGPRRPSDVAELVADSRAIRAQLGWQPAFADLHSIVETAWRWHQGHPDGFADRAQLASNPSK
jgi:UDP-glucose 4-epimerase